MPCKDCYNGCVEPVSDNCVKYTGPDLEFLDITSGDPLSAVITAVTSYLEEISSGQFPVEFNQEIICEWMAGFFPVSSNSTVEGIGLPDIIEGLIQAICSLKENVVALETDPTYDIACLEDVTSTSSTEEILQQLITQFCALLEAYTAFSTTLPTYTVASIGTGAQVYKNTTTVVNANTFNLRKINTSNSGTGESVLKTIVENTNDISIIGKKLSSTNIAITSDIDTIYLNNPAGISDTALYVNSLYVPTYADFLNVNNLGKGEGTLSKPFTNTHVINPNGTIASIVADTAIQNALDGNATNSYVGSGTRLAPQRLGQTIIVQENGGIYTFAGHLNYSYLKLKAEAQVISTISGMLVDMEDAAGFDQTQATITIDIDKDKVLRVQGNGFKNNGSTTVTTNYALAKICNLLGEGTILSFGTDISKYLINSDTSDTGNNNDGNLTFNIECKLRADSQGVYRVGGVSRIDLYNSATSGLIAPSPSPNIAIKAFHQTGGQVRAFGEATIGFNGGTRTDAVTFTPSVGFTPILIGDGANFVGLAVNLFTKTTTANVTLIINGIKGLYSTAVTNVFESPNLWYVTFTDNIIAYGSIDITKADLTQGNTVNAVNTIGGYIIESLRFFTSKESARTNGIPKNAAFILKRDVDAVDLVLQTEYQVKTAGSPSLGTVGTYFIATGAETGTGVATLIERCTLL